MVEESVVIGRMNYLRGLFAVLIVIGHCSMRYAEEVMPWFVIHKSNMLLVAFFFIMSGWGLSYNYYNKEGYLNGFLEKKVLKLFLAAIICQIISDVLYLIILQRKIIIRVGIIASFNWYIYEQIFFYIVFYLIYKYILDKKNRIVVLWCISITFSIIMLYMSNDYGFVHAYHFSSLCFAWGIVIHEHYDLFISLLRKRLMASFIVALILGLSCASLKMPQGSLIGGVFLHNLAGISAITIIVIGATVIDYRRIPMIGMLTQISTEIYLYQFVVLDIIEELFCKSSMKIDYLYIIAVVNTTLFIAIAMKMVDSVLGHVLGNANN